MYNTGQNYKDKVFADSTQHELNIYIDGNKVDSNHIIDFKQTKELFNNNEFCLGCTPEIDIEFEIDKRDLPEMYNEVYIETGIDDEIIPIGYFTIQKPIEDNEFKVKIKATDYMKKFEDNKYDGSDLTYPQTMLQVLQDICKKIGVELGSTSFLNSNKQIAVYDNTVSARTYLSYIAEQAGGIAVIGRDGKLYIRQIGENVIDFNINLFKDYKWGDKFKVSKVSYEDGIQDYKFGDETADTVYIDQNNMYIVDNEQVENIYNQIKDFEIYSFEGETIIDPAYDIGDILVIDGKRVLYQGELEYAGKFKANIKSKIQAKTEQESMQTKKSSAEKIRRIQSEINQIDGTITQLTQETTETSEKLTQVEQDVEGIKQSVKNITDFTREVTQVNEVHLSDTVNLDKAIIDFKVEGNTNNFIYLTPSNMLTPSNNLVPLGGHITLVCDNKSRINKSENAVEYDITLDEPLRCKDEVVDELRITNGKVVVIRRIGVASDLSLYVLNEETTEELGKVDIRTFDKDTYIYIKEYTSLKYYCKYITDNDYIDIFATQEDLEKAVVELDTSFTQTAKDITAEVNEKVGKEEFGTQLSLNKDALKMAWNLISEFIQLMIINNNASFAILDENKKVLMALDKTGQHFYKEDGTVFGELGVKDIKEIDDYGNETYRNYINFSIEGEYGETSKEGMAWGITTKSDGKFHPVLYIRDFKSGEQQSDASYGVLELAYCDLLLNGIGTGIISGGVKMFGDVGLYFYDIENDDSIFSIIPANAIDGAEVNILDKIKFYKNNGNSNSFKIGDDEHYCLFTDDGYISCDELYSRGGITAVGYVQGQEFLNVSLATTKKNIRKYDHSAINEIKKTDIYTYNYKTDKKGTKKRIGAVIGDKYNVSSEIIGTTQQGIDTYSMISITYKAIQEQQEIIEQLQEKDKKKDEIIKDLIKRIEFLEKGGERNGENSI